MCGCHVITHLLHGVHSLGGLDGELEEAQYSPHNVDHGVRGADRGLDVAHMAPGVPEREGPGQLGGDACGQLRGAIKGVFAREAIELLEGQVRNL